MTPITPQDGAHSDAAATLDERTRNAVERNARHMKPREYAWLKAQEFQPPIRRALIAEYERLHEVKP